MIRHLGYCCINRSLSDKVRIASQRDKVYCRTLTDKTWNLDSVSSLSLQNLKDLLTILKWNKEHGIKLFRFASDLFPKIDHPEKGLYRAWSISTLKDYQEIAKTIAEIRQLCFDNSFRVGFHPGPFVNLGSPNPDVVNDSIRTLEIFADMCSWFGIEGMTINIHVGGPYGDKQATAIRFANVCKSISYSLLSRLTVENDDKESGYSVLELSQLLPGFKIVMDFHHHSLHSSGLSVEDAFQIAHKSWGDTVPLTHYSESAEGNNPRKHSEYISKTIPLSDSPIFFDCEIESKGKDLSLLQYKLDRLSR